VKRKRQCLREDQPKAPNIVPSSRCMVMLRSSLFLLPSFSVVEAKIQRFTIRATTIGERRHTPEARCSQMSLGFIVTTGDRQNFGSVPMLW